MNKALLVFLLTVFFTSAFAQEFYNEIKSDKNEIPLLIKELSTKEILVAVSRINTDTNYTLYKLDAKGHILRYLTFLITDSVWQLKAIHETSYGYLLCNQIRSKINKRSVYLKLIGVDKNFIVLFDRNNLIVDSATTAHEVTSDIDELNGKKVIFSTIHDLANKFYFKAMQYDEQGNIKQSAVYSPVTTSHGFIQNIKLKNDGTATAFIQTNEVHELFLDSNLNVITDFVPKDAIGMQMKIGPYSNNLNILTDSSSIYFSDINDTGDTLGLSHPHLTYFEKNKNTINRKLFFSPDWNQYSSANKNNLTHDDQNIIAAISYEHYASPLDDYKIVVSKFDLQLNKIWEREIYSSTYLSVREVIILSDGSCLILAQKSDGISKWNTYIIKISENGVVNVVTDLNQHRDVIILCPNPGNDLVRIEGMEARQLTLFDMTGNSFILRSSDNIFNTEKLSNGIYFYQIIDENTGIITSGKWIKE